MKKAGFYSIAFLLCLAIIVSMNNRFVQSMIYPAPSIAVPEKPPASFTRPAWDLEIDGWLYEPERSARKQVMIYFHGNGENLETLRRSGLLEELQAFQIPFLVVDYPGYGRSKGSASEENILRNSAGAVNWLKGRFADHLIILCGWSLGASVAVQTAQQTGQADALIAMSTWTSLRDVAALHFSEWLVGFALKERYDALRAAQDITCPVLMIHGELDDLIPAGQGKKVASTMKALTRWVLLPSVGHNDLLSQPVVWKEIADFLTGLI
ncbi:alpha/beta hydrolase [bacterium]|nr:alpha/beta hydrolase [bacterium]MCI0601503.1 alpha/beta hydrolase [bacterium]